MYSVKAWINRTMLDFAVHFDLGNIHARPNDHLTYAQLHMYNL